MAYLHLRDKNAIYRRSLVVTECLHSCNTNKYNCIKEFAVCVYKIRKRQTAHGFLKIGTNLASNLAYIRR